MKPLDRYTVELSIIAIVTIAVILTTPTEFNSVIILLSILAYTVAGWQLIDETVDGLQRPLTRVVFLVASAILVWAFSAILGGAVWP